MKDLKLKDLNLRLEESRYIIERKEMLIIINASQMMNYCMLSKSLQNKKKAKITNNNKSSLKIKKE